MFYSLFVHSCVFLLFRELSVPISSLHFTICWFGGCRMVRCSLGSVAGLQACLRGTWTRQSHQPPPRLPPNPWHPQELPERVDFVSLALIYVQPFCFGFKMHFSKQITELKKKTKNKSVVHEFCIKSFLQESSFSVCSIATRVRVVSSPSPPARKTLNIWRGTQVCWDKSLWGVGGCICVCVCVIIAKWWPSVCLSVWGRGDLHWHTDADTATRRKSAKQKRWKRSAAAMSGLLVTPPHPPPPPLCQHIKWMRASRHVNGWTRWKAEVGRVKWKTRKKKRRRRIRRAGDGWKPLENERNEERRWWTLGTLRSHINYGKRVCMCVCVRESNLSLWRQRNQI